MRPSCQAEAGLLQSGWLLVPFKVVVEWCMWPGFQASMGQLCSPRTKAAEQSADALAMLLGARKHRSCSCPPTKGVNGC